MTIVCVVRHGETEWNRLGRIQGQEDVPLNHSGEVQAELCGRHLATEEWQVIITSPLQRARKTAELINTYVRAGISYEMNDLRERDYGAASGLTSNERATKFPDGAAPGIEPRPVLIARSMQALDAIAQRHPGQKVILVSHGGVINAMLAHISNGTIGAGKTTLANTSINRLVHDRGEWDIVSFNFIEHLGLPIDPIQ